MPLLEEMLAALPADAPVREVRVGPFLTAVASAGCGLASTVLDPEAAHGAPAVTTPGQLTGGSALGLARLLCSALPAERGIGLAALNSLLPVDEGRCRELNAAELLLEKGSGRRVAMVGHFPFAERLRAAAARLDVLELRPLGEDLPAAAAAEVLPRAEVVAITGSALVNRTLGDLLRLCARGAYVVVLGPSTPLSPVWFAHGVTAVSGTVVADEDLVLRQVSQGAVFHQVRGVRRLTMLAELG
jgi:uncharacterized protein